MKQEMIVRWQVLLCVKLGRSQSKLISEGLRSDDFTADYVEIRFEDGSYCRFNDAFSIVDHEKHLAAVFTEHCGYHEFSSLGASVIESNANGKNIIAEGNW